MKVYQCIHKYPPHIPAFERRHSIENKDLTFKELQKLLLKDGYYATYILKPALEGRDEEVFYTIWDYERLQFKWAEEQGLGTRDLTEIKLAQIEAFQPDVFYNHSPRYDGNFINRLNGIKNLKKICWDAIITKYPQLHEDYDYRLTLFEPFVHYWLGKGLNAGILTPTYWPEWKSFSQEKRTIDVLFYGQYHEGFFQNRNSLVRNLLKWQSNKPYEVKVHLQCRHKYIPYIKRKGLQRVTQFKRFPPKVVRDHALPPLYGSELYQAIGNAKIVINAFGDHNNLYKENMRNYEATGCGALLISEDGIYPDFLIPDEDFLTYSSMESLFEKIEYALALPDQGRAMADKARQNLITQCSKQKQWEDFFKIAESI